MVDKSRVCETINHMWQLIFEVFFIGSGAFIIIMFLRMKGPGRLLKEKLESVRREKEIKSSVFPS